MWDVFTQFILTDPNKYIQVAFLHFNLHMIQQRKKKCESKFLNCIHKILQKIFLPFENAPWSLKYIFTTKLAR